MGQVVVFLGDTGVPSVLVPSDECLKEHTLMEIAIKDVVMVPIPPSM
jgi:hypothetical protein